MSIIKKEFPNQSLSLEIDMYQKDGALIIKMEIPGIDEKNLSVEIEDGQLHIFGKRRVINQMQDLGKESEYHFFDRLTSLPEDIDKAGMAYSIQDELLTVIIPKR